MSDLKQMNIGGQVVPYLKDEIQVFTNGNLGLSLRGIDIDGEAWLVGKDVADVLEYNEPNKAIVRHVDKDDRTKYPIVDKLGRKQESWIVNESGFYSLILRSDMPKAKEFKRWVTSEVLPQIRKTGGYIPINEEETEQDILAKALLIAQNTLKRKDELLKSKDKELEEKNRFINQLAASENSLLVREVAKVASKQNIVIGEKKDYGRS